MKRKVDEVRKRLDVLYDKLRDKTVGHVNGDSVALCLKLVLPISVDSSYFRQRASDVPR